MSDRKLGLAVALALCLLGAGSLPVASADTWYVALDGSDQSGDGSSARPFRTIAYALNEGIPAAGGGVVLVRDGTYRSSSTLRRGFPATVTLRAEHPHGVTLTGVDQGREAIRVYVRGAARIAIEGFVLSNRHPTHSCDGGREAYYLMHLQNVEDLLLRDNIFFGNNAPGTCNELLKINRSTTESYPRNIRVSGNLFYEPANANGADLIDSVRPGELDISDNIFFSSPDRNRSQSFITLKRQVPSASGPSGPRSPRYRIQRNIFLSWGGKADQAFVQFGEDGVPEHEITDALIENNLFLGDSSARMAAPIQLKGVRGVLVRANTTVGDLPGGAFGFRIGTEGENPSVGDIVIRNNIWSDPTGTMSRFINAYGEVDLESFTLSRNLFWNAGEPLPAGGAIAPVTDSESVVADPLLGQRAPTAIVLPIWNSETGRFASGSLSIREEFLRIVEQYAALDSSSPAVNAATTEDMPKTDIRGLPRDTFPDIGAFEHVELSPTPAATPELTPGPDPGPLPENRPIYLPFLLNPW